MKKGVSPRKYDIDDLRKAVSESTSTAQVLRKLGIDPHGGNYATFRKLIAQYDIDTSHFTGQLWNKGRSFGPKRPIEDYLSNKVYIRSGELRQRLIREKIFEKRCQGCGNTHWMGEPIPLELDHVDGNHADNSLSNLRILCPNCHALTPTHRGKNRGRYSGMGGRGSPEFLPRQ